MFGDDFKKELEPIKVSPELLEKTRKAIEQARLEQAQESLNKADSSSFRRRHTIRIIAVAACAVLLVGGGILLLPGLTGNKQSASRDLVSKHDSAVAELADSIDKAVEGNYASQTTVAAWEAEDLNEATTTAPLFDDNVKESADETLNNSLTFSIPSGKKYWFASLNVGGKSLSINAKKKSISLFDTSNKRGEAEEIELPDLKDDQYISEMSYSEDLKILFVQVVDGNGEESYFIYDYVDGKFVFRTELKK